MPANYRLPSSRNILRNVGENKGMKLILTGLRTLLLFYLLTIPERFWHKVEIYLLISLRGANNLNKKVSAKVRQRYESGINNTVKIPKFDNMVTHKI